MNKMVSCMMISMMSDQGELRPREQEGENGKEEDERGRGREAPLGRVNQALQSPESDAQAMPEPENPLDRAATSAVGSPARAALVLNVLGVVLLVVGVAAVGLGMWVLQPVWLWMVIGVAAFVAGAVMLVSARRRRA